MLPNQFQEIQQLGNTIAGYHAWPCIDKIRETLEECHPPFIVSPTGDDAIVFLQDMFENTVNATLLDEEVAEYITVDSLKHYQEYQEPKKFKCIVKLGLDSSSLHPMMKQEGELVGKDSNCFGTWFSILQIVAKTNGKWKPYFHNHLANSSSSCRPLRLVNHKETPLTSRAEIDRLKQEIADLKPLRWSNVCEIELQPFISMVDGSIVNDWVHNACTKKCPTCKKGEADWGEDGLKSNPISDLSQETIDNLAFSTLHLGVNTWKHVCNLGYRWELETYVVRAAFKHLKDAKKMKVQEMYAKDKGLLIDFVKQGFGSSMDGNTARRGLADPEYAEMVMGVPHEIVEDFRDLWIMFKASFRLCPDKVEKECKEILARYKRLCPWGQMPPTIHKALVHGHEYLRKVPETLTLGHFSEEPLEASHKTLRRIELANARQFSREMRLTDVMKRLLDISYPVILAKKSAKHHRSLLNERPEYPLRVKLLAETPMSPVEEMEID